MINSVVLLADVRLCIIYQACLKLLSVPLAYGDKVLAFAWQYYYRLQIKYKRQIKFIITALRLTTKQHSLSIKRPFLCQRSALESSPFEREIHHRFAVALHHLYVPFVLLSADSLLNPVIHGMNNPPFLTLFRRLATLPKSIIVSITLSS